MAQEILAQTSRQPRIPSSVLGELVVAERTTRGGGLRAVVWRVGHDAFGRWKATPIARILRPTISSPPPNEAGTPAGVGIQGEENVLSGREP